MARRNQAQSCVLAIFYDLGERSENTFVFASDVGKIYGGAFSTACYHGVASASTPSEFGAPYGRTIRRRMDASDPGVARPHAHARHHTRGSRRAHHDRERSELGLPERTRTDA